ncbi:MAG: PaaI family thioesterase [Myxococcota bacterium]
METSAKTWIEKAPFTEALGVRVEALSAESARLVLPYKDENSNPGKVLHGGAAASLIELGGQAVARQALGEGAGPFHTASLQVNYLAAAIDQPIVAAARLLRRGKEICHTEVQVGTGEGKPVARGIATVRGRFGGDAAPPSLATGDDGAADPGVMGPHLHMIPFVKRLGIEVEHMAGGRSRIRMPFQGRNADLDGCVHPGPMLALLDTTGAMACWALTGYGPYKASTVAIQAQMFGYPVEGDLVGYGRLLRRDREIFWSDVEMAEQPGGRVAARGTVIYRIVVPDETAEG